jgi:hypothetical protein
MLTRGLIMAYVRILIPFSPMTACAQVNGKVH